MAPERVLPFGQFWASWVESSAGLTNRSYPNGIGMSGPPKYNFPCDIGAASDERTSRCDEMTTAEPVWRGRGWKIANLFGLARQAGKGLSSRARSTMVCLNRRMTAGAGVRSLTGWRPPRSSSWLFRLTAFYMPEQMTESGSLLIKD